MKESNFYSDDFEQLIRGKTEQYKMYPSENVWKGVHSALHTKRKWFIGSMAMLVTGILFMAGRELILPSKNNSALHKIAGVGSLAADASKSPENTTRSPLVVIRPLNATAATRHNNLTPDPATAGISITLSHPVLTQSDLSEWLSQVVRLPAQAPDLAVIAAKTPDQSKEDIAKESSDNGAAAASTGTTSALARSWADEQTDGVTAHNVLESLTAQQAPGDQHAHAGTKLESSRSDRGTVAGNSRLPASTGVSTKASATEIAEREDANRVNWLHDYAMNILDATPKSGRTYLQLSLTPTINYRSLGGSDPQPEKPYPAAGLTYPGSPNQYVDHSPAVGFAFNGSIIYRLTRNLSVKGGLQFNYSRYPIKAYEYTRAPQGTPTLQTAYGAALDSLTGSMNPAGITATRTAVTVYNDYYQLSAPVGFELRVLGNERLQFNLAATIAPTYLLNSSSYMLSSAYTKYDKEPNKYRNLNFYAGAEAFLSYKVGNIRWQIGPEFRYQLLSSYISSESLTEKVKSYGLKIGITKALP